MEQKITEQLKVAMLARDTITTNALKSLKSGMKMAEIEKRSKSSEPLTEAEIVETFTKQYKMRLESILAYQTAGQNEKVADEQAEADLIKTFLPQAIEGEELEKLVSDAVASLGNPNMGMVIGKVKALAGGKMVDMAVVAKLVNAKLNEK
jgi:uncharacterized protein